MRSRKGAQIAHGGKRHALGGTFFQPTMVTDVTPKMLMAREETFGPVAPLFRFETETEAIRMANDTEFGLASYFYTRDLARSWRVAEALEYGIVGLNTGLISTEVAPFGGMKESGHGSGRLQVRHPGLHGAQVPLRGRRLRPPWGGKWRLRYATYALHQLTRLPSGRRRTDRHSAGQLRHARGSLNRGRCASSSRASWAIRAWSSCRARCGCRFCTDSFCRSDRDAPRASTARSGRDPARRCLTSPSGCARS